MNADEITIQAMLEYRRPEGSVTEQAFIDRFILPLGARKDLFGNHIVTIGKKPTVLWSSHTDTVHRGDGMQVVRFDGKNMRLGKKSKSSCLGADCAAGVWMMTEMIVAQVPGLYVFHFGEEGGCKGSSDIASQDPKLLAGIQSAIAFDRKGTSSIITHMAYGRTCSDTFGKSLIEQLPGYQLDPGGTLTDTIEYMNIVPECTNISVGYINQHYANETQDVKHLQHLRDIMLKIDASKFVIARDPSVKEPKKASSGSFFSSGPKGWSPPKVADLVYSHPEEVAIMLESIGVGGFALETAINRICRDRREKSERLERARLKRSKPHGAETSRLNDRPSDSTIFNPNGELLLEPEHDDIDMAA